MVPLLWCHVTRSWIKSNGKIKLLLRVCPHVYILHISFVPSDVGLCFTKASNSNWEVHMAHVLTWEVTFYKCETSSKTPAFATRQPPLACGEVMGSRKDYVMTSFIIFIHWRSVLIVIWDLSCLQHAIFILAYLLPKNSWSVSLIWSHQFYLRLSFWSKGVLMFIWHITLLAFKVMWGFSSCLPSIAACSLSSTSCIQIRDTTYSWYLTLIPL